MRKWKNSSLTTCKQAKQCANETLAHSKANSGPTAPGHSRALTRDNPDPGPEPSICTGPGPSGRALNEDKHGSNLESGGDSHAVLFEVSAYDVLFFNLNLMFIVRPMQEEAKALHSKLNRGLRGVQALQAGVQLDGATCISGAGEDPSVRKQGSKVPP